MKNKILRKIEKTAGMTALAGALALGIYAGKAKAEEAKDSTQVQVEKKPSYDVFSGTLLFAPEDEINSIFQLDHQNGARAIVEANNTPWTDKVNETSVALRSPQLGKLQGELSYDNTNVDPASYTGIVTGKFGDNLAVRAGVVGNQEGNGGFVGGKTSLEGITLNGNVFRHDGNTNANGYVSYSVPLSESYNGFVSVGGSTNKDQIASVAGIISDGQAGVYNQVVVDKAKDEQTGRIIFAPKGWARKAGNYEFREAVQTNAEMDGEFSDNTIIGWAPYDAQSVDGVKGHNSVVAKWSNDKNTAKMQAGLWNRSNTGNLVGITPKLTYDKNSRQVTPSLIGDLSYGIPGTPLGAALQVEQNLRDGSTKSLIYLGYVGRF